METTHCRCDLSVHEINSDFSRLPTAVFNFRVKWHRVPMDLEDTMLFESRRSLEIPLCILSWPSLCETHLDRILHDLGVDCSCWTGIIPAIMRTALWVSSHFRRQFRMTIKLEFGTEEDVETEDTDDVFTEGHESDPDQALRGVSRSTIEKLERESCFVRDGDERCCICLEKLEGKVMEIPCSHQFHSSCIVEWLERNDSCPLCRSKVEVEDSE